MRLTEIREATVQTVDGLERMFIPDPGGEATSNLAHIVGYVGTWFGSAAACIPAAGTIGWAFITNEPKSSRSGSLAFGHGRHS